MSSIAHWTRRFKVGIARSEAVQRVISAAQIEQRCVELGHRWRKSFWSPGTTFTCSLLQVLNKSKTLRGAVASMAAELVRSGGDAELPSLDPSAFAQARQRLPQELFEATFAETAAEAGRLAGERLWHGRRVFIVDGSSVSLPDTPELQAAFPQSSQQKPGCGFPTAYLSAVFCWSTGALVQLAIGSKHDSELKRFRDLLGCFSPGDLVLGDRLYCTYCDIARLRELGVDVAVRLHQGRRDDFRQGKPLGKDDRLVEWDRPKECRPGFGLEKEEFKSLPESMTLRMVRVRLTKRRSRRSKTRRGRVRKKATPVSRSNEIVIVTSLLNPKKVSRRALLNLYRSRWLAELNLRHMKSTLQMAELRSKSVDVVKKELLTHAIVYNLIRMYMWEAARASGRELRDMSFAAVVDQLQSIAAGIFYGSCDTDALLGLVLRTLETNRVPNRPARMEPRKKKRRPKGYDYLTEPRDVCRQRLRGFCA